MPASHDGAKATAKLQQLSAMRLVAIVAQLVAVAAADRLLGIELPLRPLVAVLAAFALFNALTWWRLQQPRRVTDAELLAQLSADMLALTLMLAMSGGTSNPFACLFLLPLALGASWLPWRHAWALAFESLACYSLLPLMARPLVPQGGSVAHDALISTAMWVSYAVTATVLVMVLLRVALALRRGEKAIEDVRSRAASDEHLARIGALAAGAAHELNSPLASVALIIDELRHTPPAERDVDGGLETISRQLAGCRQTLATLLCYGNSTFCSPPDRLAADRLVGSCLDDFRARRPEAVALRIETAGKPPVVLANRALNQAFTCVLDNAADVSPKSIEVAVSWDAEWVHVRVSDRGPGIAPSVIEGVGKLLFITTKENGKGNGLGLYLANTAVIRCGGSLTLANARDGGAVVHIALPALEAWIPEPCPGAS